MSNRYFPHLFEPIRLGKTLFRSRIFASPQDFANLTSENCLTDEAIAFYERTARGGFATVCVGDCARARKARQAMEEGYWAAVNLA